MYIFQHILMFYIYYYISYTILYYTNFYIIFFVVRIISPVRNFKTTKKNKKMQLIIAPYVHTKTV